MHITCILQGTVSVHYNALDLYTTMHCTCTLQCTAPVNYNTLYLYTTMDCIYTLQCTESVQCTAPVHYSALHLYTIHYSAPYRMHDTLCWFGVPLCWTVHSKLCSILEFSNQCYLMLCTVCNVFVQCSVQCVVLFWPLEILEDARASHRMACTAWHRMVCTALRCTALHCTELHCTALHYTALHCTELHCTAIHCTAGNATSTCVKLCIRMCQKY